MLLDSVIIILAAKPEGGDLRRFIADRGPTVSAVSYVEALGYHKLEEPERSYLESFFAIARVLPIDREVLDRAVVLRRAKKMSLGDALIAATALVHGLALVTRNTKDFAWIEGLSLIDPLATSHQAPGSNGGDPLPSASGPAAN